MPASALHIHSERESAHLIRTGSSSECCLAIPTSRESVEDEVVVVMLCVKEFWAKARDPECPCHPPCEFTGSMATLQLHHTFCNQSSTEQVQVNGKTHPDAMMRDLHRAKTLKIHIRKPKAKMMMMQQADSSTSSEEQHPLQSMTSSKQLLSL